MKSLMGAGEAAEALAVSNKPDISKPWALMRHHAGWADIFHVESETVEGVTGFYPDRESDERVTYTAYAVLARFHTVDAARSARERGLAERRKHDAAVDAAHAALKAAEKAREDAWVAGLRAAAGEEAPAS